MWRDVERWRDEGWREMKDGWSGEMKSVKQNHKNYTENELKSLSLVV